MVEKKNIVLVLGNGFDLDLGLKTSYKDFWESDFCPKDYPSPLICHLNGKWNDNIETVRWYDLENELLEYYKYCSKQLRKEDVLPEKEMSFIRNYENWCFNYKFDDEKISMINRLIDKGRIVYSNSINHHPEVPYLEDYKLSIRERDCKAFSLIKNKLCEYLCKQMKDKIKTNVCAQSILRSIEIAHDHGDDVSIFSFNYTDVPLMDQDLKSKSVYYVHGNCKMDNIIIGTKDVEMSDISYVFLQKAFDKNFNPPAIVSALSRATDVLFFGHSLGINDSQYFRDFFEKQSSISNEPKRITLITYDDNSEIEIKYSLQNLTGTRLSALYAQNDVTIIKTATVLDNPLPLRDLINTYIGNVNRANALIPRKQ